MTPAVKANGSAPAAAALPAPPRTGEVGELLSPSQVERFLDCPALWYFHDLLGLPEPTTGPLALGRAVHTALLAVNFAQKIGTGRDLAAREVLEAFDTAFEEQAEGARIMDGERPALVGTGRDLVACYMREAAPRIQPAAVEFHVEGAIAGVRVHGIVDLLETDGTLVDLKTAGKRPAEISGDHRFQLTTYDLLTPASRGKVRIDTLVKTRTAQLVQISESLGPADTQLAETVYPMVQDAIRDGVYYPRRGGSWKCSRRYCSYWRECEREFGGRVPL